MSEAPRRGSLTFKWMIFDWSRNQEYGHRAYLALSGLAIGIGRQAQHCSAIDSFVPVRPRSVRKIDRSVLGCGSRKFAAGDCESRTSRLFSGSSFLTIGDRFTEHCGLETTALGLPYPRFSGHRCADRGWFAGWATLPHRQKPIFARLESAPDRTVILRAQTLGFCRPATTDTNRSSAQ